MYITHTEAGYPDYVPGVKRQSAYRSLWRNYSPGFVKGYDANFVRAYGALTGEKKEEISKLAACGEFTNGFTVHSCLSCGIKLVVPFTCKSRLCLSCRRKSLFGWSVRLSELMDTSLHHVHATFTIPGRVKAMIRGSTLFSANGSGFDEHDLIPLASSVYIKLIRMSKAVNRKHLYPGILASLHKCGNSLNYNPHVHLVGTTELVTRTSGEIVKAGFIHYTKARFLWRDAVCRLLTSKNVISPETVSIIKETYRDGFHVYFTHIKGGNNGLLGRTAEYLAAGYFHNSLITAVDHRKKTVTFRYKKHVDRSSREKTYGTMTLPIFDFMARMLYYLPDKHGKEIRWYGIYANGIRKKLEQKGRGTWAAAITCSFSKKPENCPSCGLGMTRRTVFSYFALRESKRLWRTHACVRGYFIPYRNDP